MWKPYAFVCVAALTFTITACEWADQASDCDKVCSRYAECFDDDFDVDGCSEDCREHADDDEDFNRSLDQCEACIEGQDCTDATFGCFDECGGVIGESD